MSEEFIEEALHHLRLMDASMKDIRATCSAMKILLDSIEEHLKGIRAMIGGPSSGICGGVTSIKQHLDRIDGCLGRIEIRLGLAPA